MTHDANWSMHLIKKSGADPEQQLVAALLVNAREGCATGDRDACEWLHSCAIAYLSLIAPPGVDEYDILERILADLPKLDPPPETWREAARVFVQRVLNAAFDDVVLVESEPQPVAPPVPRSRDPSPFAQIQMSGLEA